VCEKRLSINTVVAHFISLISPSAYKPIQNPWQSCINPGLTSGSLRYVNLSSNTSISGFSLFSTHVLDNEENWHGDPALDQFQAPLTLWEWRKGGAPAIKGSRRAVIGCNRVFSSFTPYLPIPQQFGRARVKLPGEGSTTLQTGFLVGHKVKKTLEKLGAFSRSSYLALQPTQGSLFTG